MTQTHKIRPSADRLVEWSDEEMMQMRAAIAACDGFIESRFPGEQPRYCEETDTQAKAPRQHRWYYDGKPIQRSKPQQKPRKKQTPREIISENLDKIRELYDTSSVPIHFIAKRFGISEYSLRYFAKEFGLRQKKRKPGETAKILEEHKDEIQQMLNDMMTKRAIALRLGVSNTLLGAFCRKHDLKYNG